MISHKKVILVRARGIDPNIKKIADSLSQHGFSVKLLVWDRDHTFKSQNCSAYTTILCKLKAPYDKPSVIFFLPIWWIYEFLYLIFNDVSFIHVSDLDTLFPAIILKLFKKNKLFYTIYDYYASNLSAKGMLTSTIAKIENLGIGCADTLFIVDPSRLTQISKASLNKIEILYNSPKDYRDLLMPANENASSNIVIFYGGLIHRSRGVTNLAKAIRQIDNVLLLIAGTGPDENLVKKLSQQNPNKIKYIGYVSHEQIINFSINSDALIALYDPALPNTKFASPNKLFEAMMCEKPIIINQETSASQIVETHKCGITVPYNDVQAIKNAIIMLKNPSLRKTLGKNGRFAYEQYYSWNIMEDRLLKSYMV